MCEAVIFRQHCEQIEPATVEIKPGPQVISALMMMQTDLPHTDRVAHREDHESRPEPTGLLTRLEHGEKMMQNHHTRLFTRMQTCLKEDFWQGGIIRTNVKTGELMGGSRTVTCNGDFCSFHRFDPCSIAVDLF